MHLLDRLLFESIERVLIFYTKSTLLVGLAVLKTMAFSAHLAPITVTGVKSSKLQAVLGESVFLCKKIFFLSNLNLAPPYTSVAALFNFNLYII